jgi:hypothetical protein
MAKRPRPNHRLVKIHYSYSVEDVAALFSIHKNTVREWLRRGLPALDRKRPLLILGSALAEFLRARRQAAKRPCKRGELYCVKCRQPRAPAGGLVEFKAIREPLGNLTAICPICDGLMYRRANRAKLPALLAEIELRAPLEDLHISQSNIASLNRDFATSPPGHANAQPEK